MTNILQKARVTGKLLTAGWLLSLSCITTSSAAPLTEINDFSALATIMQDTQKPLVLAFDAVDCHYCKRLEAEHLQPMADDSGYTDRIMLGTHAFDGSHDIKDFDGETLSAGAFNKKYKVRLTPTVLFLNNKGEEIAERLLGYSSPDFYGAYMDKAIQEAGKAMMNGSVAAPED